MATANVCCLIPDPTISADDLATCIRRKELQQAVVVALGTREGTSRADRETLHVLVGELGLQENMLRAALATKTQTRFCEKCERHVVPRMDQGDPLCPHCGLVL